jgi:hypothetical protein
MRNRTVPTLLGVCLTLVLAAAAAPGARAADDGAALAAPAGADLEAPAPAPEPALACPADPLEAPVFLAPPPPQTCEECLTDCDAAFHRCINHCNDRLCITKCEDKYFMCQSKCPC